MSLFQCKIGNMRVDHADEIRKASIQERQVQSLSKKLPTPPSYKASCNIKPSTITVELMISSIYQIREQYDAGITHCYYYVELSLTCNNTIKHLVSTSNHGD